MGMSNQGLVTLTFAVVQDFLYYLTTSNGNVYHMSRVIHLTGLFRVIIIILFKSVPLKQTMMFDFFMIIFSLITTCWSKQHGPMHDSNIMNMNIIDIHSNFRYIILSSQNSSIIWFQKMQLYALKLSIFSAMQWLQTQHVM